MMIAVLFLFPKRKFHMGFKYTLTDIKDIPEDLELYDSFGKILEKNTGFFTDETFRQCNEIIFNYTKLHSNVILQEPISQADSDRIKNCLATARKFLCESISEQNIVKTIIALCLINFYEQDFSLFEGIEFPSAYKNILFESTKNISLNFNLQKLADYSEHKRLDVFNEAKKANDYSALLKMMDEFSLNSSIFGRIEKSWGILFCWLWFLEKAFIYKLLEKSNSETIEAIFISLEDRILEIVFHYKSDSNYYPLLRGFMLLFHLYDKKLRQKEIKAVQELPDFTDSFIRVWNDDKISLATYIPFMRIRHLQSFNYCFGKAVEKDISLLNLYISFAEMDYKSSEAFTLGFLENADSETVLIVGEAIIKEFFDKKIESHDAVNKAIGYFNLITDYFYEKFSTREKYRERLSAISSAIIKLQNSWDFQNIKKYWIELFYLALTNNLLKFYFSASELESVVPVLFDKRQEIICGKENIETMKALLTSLVKVVKLKHFSDDIELEFKAKESL